MQKTAEKTAEPALPLEGAVAEAQPSSSKSRAVAAHKGQPPASAPAASPARSEHQALLDMILAASANPKVDIDKFERMVAMRERAVALAKEEAFNESMTAAQTEMTPIRVDLENKETKSKYASAAALDRALRPIYTKHGFALSYDTEPNQAPEMMTVVCYVTAKGHTRKYTIDMPTDGKGPKGGAVMSRIHATGAGTTYGKRYLKGMIFDIAVFKDDDGNAASKTVIDNVDPDVPKINQKQIDALIEKCEAVGCPRPKFLAWAKVAKFEDIPADLFDGCMDGLNAFQKAK